MSSWIMGVRVLEYRRVYVRAQGCAYTNCPLVCVAVFILTVRFLITAPSSDWR